MGEELRERIRRLYKQGWSYRRIARKLRVSYSTISEALKEGSGEPLESKGFGETPIVDSRKLLSPEEFKEMLKPMVREVLAELIREEFEEERGFRPRYSEREVEFKEVVTVPKKLRLSPRTIQYYHWFISKSGVNMSLEEFIDAVVDEHFKECLGVEVAILRR